MNFPLAQFRDYIARMFSICRDALREIFDEAAYARFLARQQMPSSAKAYSKFLREQAVIRSHPRRCC